MLRLKKEKKRKENSFRLKCLGPLKVQINGHFIKVLPQLSNIVIPAHSKLEAPWQSTTLSTNWNKGIDWLVHIKIYEDIRSQKVEDKG